MSNKYNILIVEPAQTEQYLYSEIFDSEEFKINFCTTGEKALKYLHENNSIDLLITDLYLTDYVSIKWIEKLRKFTHIPILVVSSIPYNSNEIAQFKNVSAFYKPYSLTQLMNAVLRLVEY